MRHTAILSLLCGLFKPLGEVSLRRGKSGLTPCRVGEPQQERAKERGSGRSRSKSKKYLTIRFLFA